MPERRIPSVSIPVLIVLLALAFLVVALSRTEPRAGRGHPAGATAPAGSEVTPPRGNAAAPRSGARPTRRSPAERAAVRERLRTEGAGTYLAEMLAANDSVIRHWAPRPGRPIRLAVLRSGAAGFRDDFPGAVAWAVTRWNGVGLPVQFETGADSALADVVVTWVDTLGAEAAGQARVTWSSAGEVLRASVQLVTHLRDGRPASTNQMVTMALHELGHVLGLGHSPDHGDALYPTSVATELSARDRRTARLLYDLPTGSVKN